MITAFLLANHDAKALTRTMNALIGATVEGLVREVVVIAETGDEAAAKLADHAGCELIISTKFAAAVQSAKGEWLMILQAGALPELGWAEAVSNHIQSGNGAARFTRSPLAERGLLKRLFQSEQPLALGLLIPKNVAHGFGNAANSTPENLAKAAKPKRLSAALRPASNAHQGAA